LKRQAEAAFFFFAVRSGPQLCVFGEFIRDALFPSLWWMQSEHGTFSFFRRRNPTSTNFSLLFFFVLTYPYGRTIFFFLFTLPKSKLTFSFLCRFQSRGTLSFLFPFLSTNRVFFFPSAQRAWLALFFFFTTQSARAFSFFLPSDRWLGERLVFPSFLAALVPAHGSVERQSFLLHESTASRDPLSPSRFPPPFFSYLLPLHSNE